MSNMPPNANSVFVIGDNPTVIGFPTSEIGVSDTTLVALLTCLGIQPILDNPRFCGMRAWWVYTSDQSEQVKSIAHQFYAPYVGGIGITLIKEVLKMRKGYAQMAKLKNAEILAGKPLTLRRL